MGIELSDSRRWGRIRQLTEGWQLDESSIRRNPQMGCPSPHNLGARQRNETGNTRTNDPMRQGNEMSYSCRSSPIEMTNIRRNSPIRREIEMTNIPRNSPIRREIEMTNIPRNPPTIYPIANYVYDLRGNEMSNSLRNSPNRPVNEMSYNRRNSPIRQGNEMSYISRSSRIPPAASPIPRPWPRNPPMGHPIPNYVYNLPGNEMSNNLRNGPNRPVNEMIYNCRNSPIRPGNETRYSCRSSPIPHPRPPIESVTEHRNVTHTETTVNLTNSALRLEENEDNPGYHFLAFPFDAAKLHWYILPGTGGLNSSIIALRSHLLVSLQTAFSRGFGQNFSQAPGTGVDLSLLEDLGVVNDGNSRDRNFPPIICLDTGQQNGWHGAPLPRGVPCRITQAGINKRG